MPIIYSFSNFIAGFRVRAHNWLLAPLLASLAGPMSQADEKPANSLPLSPETSRSRIQLSDSSLVAELVASEPAISSPVAIAWDEHLRLFVAEMRDYPRGTGGGSIRVLEDRNQDGVYETSSVFAGGLPFPNSVLPVRGGLLVSAAPDIWFLEDRDGDGSAEIRTKILTGFGTGNQQLRVNGLSWGLDNWIYGANGRSDGEIRSSTDGQGPWGIRGRDFRFRFGTSVQFESLAGRSQFGLGLDDWGDRFLSWNTIPLRHEVFRDSHFSRHPGNQPADVLVDCLPERDLGEVFPLTPPPLVFNNESGSHFNALSGLHIFRGDGLGPEYAGNAFVGESLRNLVHRRVLLNNGATYKAVRRETKSEFLSSADPWFHPVNFATGPDGSLYVVDFYRRFVEHPDWVAKDMRERVPWDQGNEFGRIWRIKRNPTGRRLSTPLAGMTPAVLADQLESPNGWCRDTAHRLILERAMTSLTQALQRKLKSSPLAQTRLHALYILFEWGALDERSLQIASQDPSPQIRARSLLLGATPGSIERAANDSDSRVKVNAALAAGKSDNAAWREGILARLVANNPRDPWILRSAAASTSISNRSWLTLAANLEGKPILHRPPPKPAGVNQDREQVLKDLSPSLKIAGSAARGARWVSNLCLPCHYLQGHGQRVGPDLSGLASKPPETILSDLLDPSRQVAPDYQTYEIEVQDGENLVGMIASESETRVTVRFAGSPDVSITKNRIKSLRATGKSLMPDGLENGLSMEDLADLLAFLKQPDGSLIQSGPDPKSGQ